MDATSQVDQASASNVGPPVLIRKMKKQPPQANVDEFWAKFNTSFPGKVYKVLPKDHFADTKAAKTPKGIVPSQTARQSYAEATAECIATVEKIATDCRRVNQKYRDPHFDIEWDLKRGQRDCLDGLVSGDWELDPKSVKRVSDIFENPVFYENGASASDVRQGANGDCWFLSALCALGSKKNLIDKVCVHRDEQVGVYGFVFHRDGEWIQTIIDDKLYLAAADFDESAHPKITFQQVDMQDPEGEYRKTYQSGSRALYFAQCSSENETWLPLLEKAYAKAHGDFNAIQGGFTGEAIEDLTGGVTTEIFASDILDTEKFWAEEMMKVNDEFLFSCSTGVFDNWQSRGEGDRKGVHPMHAYSILDAREVKGEKLVLVRNPWGKSEWRGPWSDGSEQWTPEWMQLLNHRFGDDGMFWISYKDLLRKYQAFDRTRIFGPEWHITQQWTTINVPWSADFSDTKFSFTLTKASPVVVVLSQLDERYFKGLEGQYVFSLNFRLERDGEIDYIARSHGNYEMNRSVNVDLELEAGNYSVFMRITAKRYTSKPIIEDIIRENCRYKQDKLIQIGLAYDLAQAKGQNEETAAEKNQREERDAKKKAAAEKQLRADLREQKLKRWQRYVKQKARDKRHAQKEENRRKRAEDVRTEENALQNGPVADDDAKILKAPAESEEIELSKLEQDAATLPSPAADSQPPESIQPFKSDGISRSDHTMESGAEKNTEKGTQDFETALQAVSSILVNGTSTNDSPAPESTAHGPPPLDSDYDSDASFDSSVDPDLDFLENPPVDAAVDTAATDGAIADDDENAEFENDPWNAVCVVGLRVYSLDKKMVVQVVRPSSEELPLDVDDVSKGASGELVGDMVGEKAVNGVTEMTEKHVSDVVGEGNEE